MVNSTETNMVPPKITLNELAAALSSPERPIEIFVGKRTEPYFVQETLLLHASDYFVKAIKHEHLGKDNVGVLRFPEDDEEAWKIILFWIVRRQMPDELRGEQMKEKSKHQLALAWAWILADRYLIPDLQDEFMAALIFKLDTARCTFEVIICSLRNTAADSRLRRLAIEELMVQLHYDGTRLSSAERDQLDEANATAELLYACVAYAHHNEGDFCKRVEDGSKVWKDFMLGGGPKQHWFKQTFCFTECCQSICTSLCGLLPEETAHFVCNAIGKGEMTIPSACRS